MTQLNADLSSHEGELDRDVYMDHDAGVIIEVSEETP